MLCRNIILNNFIFFFYTLTYIPLTKQNVTKITTLAENWDNTKGKVTNMWETKTVMYTRYWIHTDTPNGQQLLPLQRLQNLNKTTNIRYSDNLAINMKDQQFNVQEYLNRIYWLDRIAVFNNLKALIN